MHNVDITPIWQIADQTIVQVATVAIPIVGAWFAWLLQRYAPKFIPAWLESKASADLNTALQNGVSIALNKAQAWESVHSNVQVQGQVTAWAAQYAADHAGDAIARFGLSPDQLATKALAFIPKPPVPAARVTLPDGTAVTIGKPSNVAIADEAAETAALNRQQAAK
ncbi:MAG TPA: hypothetical protein VKR31_00955 [Rhizomicrobium sp.]|nr:hypothetical protein [Rhizomicrobium sp.]